jgi:predicted HNH restriction endonuclease
MGRNFLIFMVAIMLLAIAGVAEGANWGFISKYEDTSIYINNETVKHVSENVIGAQFKIVYEKPSWIRSKAIDHYLIMQENDCSGKKYKVSKVTVYFDDGTNNTYDTKEEHDVRTDTFQSVIYDFLCKKKK